MVGFRAKVQVWVWMLGQGSCFEISRVSGREVDVGFWDWGRGRVSGSGSRSGFRIGVGVELSGFDKGLGWVSG